MNDGRNVRAMGIVFRIFSVKLDELVHCLSFLDLKNNLQNYSA